MSTQYYRPRAMDPQLRQHRVRRHRTRVFDAEELQESGESGESGVIRYKKDTLREVSFRDKRLFFHK